MCPVFHAQWLELKIDLHLSGAFWLALVCCRCFSVRVLFQATSNNEEIESDIVDATCHQCKKGDKPEKMLLCDTCDRGWHLYCLNPPLKAIPSGDWSCPKCIARDAKKMQESDPRGWLQERQCATEHEVTLAISLWVWHALLRFSTKEEFARQHKIGDICGTMRALNMACGCNLAATARLYCKDTRIPLQLLLSALHMIIPVRFRKFAMLLRLLIMHAREHT